MLRRVADLSPRHTVLPLIGHFPDTIQWQALSTSSTLFSKPGTSCGFAEHLHLLASS